MTVLIFDDNMLMYDDDVIIESVLCDLIHQKWTIHIVATIVMKQRKRVAQYQKQL